MEAEKEEEERGELEERVREKKRGLWCGEDGWNSGTGGIAWEDDEDKEEEEEEEEVDVVVVDNQEGLKGADKEERREDFGVDIGSDLLFSSSVGCDSSGSSFSSYFS